MHALNLVQHTHFESMSNIKFEGTIYAEDKIFSVLPVLIMTKLLVSDFYIHRNWKH